MKPVLRLATRQSINELLSLVKQYHQFEELPLNDRDREEVILPLLDDDSLGRIWMVEYDKQFIGYIVLCFCYSIEHGGREAFVDEFFLIQAYRGRGIGKEVVSLAIEQAEELNIKALHLEVASMNSTAINLYKSIGFVPRDKYHLYTYLIEHNLSE